MIRRTSFILALIVTMVLTASLPNKAMAANDIFDLPEVTIYSGMQDFIKDSRNIIRAAISDESIAEVTAISDRELRLLGKKNGRTSLSIWYAGRNGGEVRKDMILIVRPNTDTVRRLLKSDPGLQGLDVRTDEGRVYLVGATSNDAALARGRELVAALVGDDVIDLAEVSGPDMIAVDVRFAAVSVSTLKSLGFDFRVLGGKIVGAAIGPNAITGFDLNSTGLDLSAGLPINDAFNLLVGKPNADILGVISALDGTDLAQVLAEPTLQVKSGETANFLAGGEVPIPVPQGSGDGSVTIEYKPFGVKLSIQPQIVEGNKIELKIEPEVSELDYANALTLQGFNVPALRRRSTNTTVALEDGQSFVLAGLMMSSTADIEERVPGLGDIPVIGAFFKRVRAVKEKQELIIIATPHLVSSSTGKTVPRSLPGETVIDYDPTAMDFILNRNTLKHKLKYQGLLP